MISSHWSKGEEGAPDDTVVGVMSETSQGISSLLVGRGDLRGFCEPWWYNIPESTGPTLKSLTVTASSHLCSCLSTVRNDHRSLLLMARMLPLLVETSKGLSYPLLFPMNLYRKYNWQSRRRPWMPPPTSVRSLALGCSREYGGGYVGNKWNIQSHILFISCVMTVRTHIYYLQTR